MATALTRSGKERQILNLRSTTYKSENVVKIGQADPEKFVSNVFYPRGASSARVIAMIACPSVCLSVCLSVTRRYCIKTAKRTITQTTPRDSPGNLVFFWPKFVGGRPPSA